MELYEIAFYLCNYGILGGWGLLIFAPRWRWTHWVVSWAPLPCLLAVVYGVMLFTDGQGSPEGSFLTLDGVAAILSSRQTVAAAWIHYLIFDLFVGAWIVRDAPRHTLSHVAVIPCLLLTLLIGPLGLLAYLTLRAALRGRLSLKEDTSP